MTQLCVGDTVLYRGHVYLVRGISPMGAAHRRVMLEDPETHELVEAPAQDFLPVGTDGA